MDLNKQADEEQKKIYTEGSPISKGSEKEALALKQEESPLVVSRPSRHRNIPSQSIHQNIAQNIQEWEEAKFTTGMLDDLVQAAKTGSILQKHWGVLGIKYLLLDQQTAPYDQVVESGIIPYIIQYAKQKQFVELQNQSLYLLGMIAYSRSHDHSQPIAEMGGIQILVELLKTSDIEIADSALSALVNMAINANHYRNCIIEEGGIKQIIGFMDRFSKKKGLDSIGCRALSKIVRGQPLPQSPAVSEAIRMLTKKIAKGELRKKAEVASIWALADHADKDQHIELLLKQNAIPAIFQVLKGALDSQIRSALKIIRYASQNPECSKKMLQLDCLSIFQQLIQYDSKTVRYKICIILSNISENSEASSTAILERESLINKIISLFQQGQNKIRKNICILFATLWVTCKLEIIHTFFREKNIMNIYVKFLLSSDNYLQFIATGNFLDLIENLSDQDEQKVNAFLAMFVEQGGVEALEKLAEQSKGDVQQNSRQLLSHLVKRKMRKNKEDQELVNLNNYNNLKLL